MTTRETHSRRFAVKPLLPLLPLLPVLGGCGLFGSTPGPAKVADFMGWVERVYVDAELAKQEMAGAVGSLRVIVAPGFYGDPVPAYQALRSSIDRSVEQARKLQQSGANMKSAAEPVFEQWTDSLDEFASASLRQHSQERLDRTRHRYNQLVIELDPVHSAYQALNSALNDHALFLTSDFNTQSLAAIRAEFPTVLGLGQALDGRLDAVIAAAAAYLEEGALPGPDLEKRDPQPQDRFAPPPPARPSLPDTDEWDTPAADPTRPPRPARDASAVPGAGAVPEAGPPPRQP